MAELRQPSTPQSISPPCCRVCLLFQGGEAVLSPQDPFPGAELAGIKCSDLRGFSVTHHLIIPQLLPAAVCSGEFTAIALPIPSHPSFPFLLLPSLSQTGPTGTGKQLPGSTRKGRWDTGGKESSSLPSPAGLSARGGHPALPLLSLLLCPCCWHCGHCPCTSPGPGWLPGLTLGRSSRTWPFLPRLALPGETDNAAGSTRALQGRLGRS